MTNSGIPGIGTGIAPNTYFTLSYWNSTFLLKVQYAAGEPTFWNGKYVLVLRKSTATAPSDSPNPPYGPGPSAAAGPLVQDEVNRTAASPEDAVVAGIVENGLSEDRVLESATRGLEFGRLLHVRSLIEESPDYVLVELVNAGKTSAVALVTELTGGYQFAGMMDAGDSYVFPRSEDAKAILAAELPTPSASLLEAVWGWSPDTRSPFFPVWQVGDSGSEVYVTPSGDVQASFAIDAGTRR